MRWAASVRSVGDAREGTSGRLGHVCSCNPLTAGAPCPETEGNQIPGIPVKRGGSRSGLPYGLG